MTILHEVMALHKVLIFGMSQGIGDIEFNSFHYRLRSRLAVAIHKSVFTYLRKRGLLNIVSITTEVQTQKV